MDMRERRETLAMHALILVVAVLGGTPETPADQFSPEALLARAKADCEANPHNCYELQRLEGEKQLAAQYNAAVTEESDADAARRKKCGRDYMRVKVGMKFSRVAECAGEFSLKYEDERANVYEAEGGLIRVEHGKITRVWRR